MPCELNAKVGSDLKFGASSIKLDDIALPNNVVYAKINQGVEDFVNVVTVCKDEEGGLVRELSYVTETKNEEGKLDRMFTRLLDTATSDTIHLFSVRRDSGYPRCKDFLVWINDDVKSDSLIPNCWRVAHINGSPDTSKVMLSICGALRRDSIYIDKGKELVWCDLPFEQSNI